MNDELTATDRELMDERARTLGKKPVDKSSAIDFAEVITVTEGREKIGLPVESVAEIVKTPPIMRLPKLPPWLIVTRRKRTGQSWVGSATF